MPYLPNWLYGLAPPGWFPDRPREPFFWALNVDGTTSGGSAIFSVEQVFDKRRDVLVWGGCVMIFSSLNPPTLLGTTNGPSPTQFLVRLSNPAGHEIYTNSTTVGTPSPTNTQPGFVPLESLFSSWQLLARRPVYWPIPIPIPRGGSLLLELLNMNIGQTKPMKFGFWASIMYDEREMVA